MGIVTGDGDGDIKAVDTKLIKYVYKINYENCYKNNFGNDAKKAVRFYLTSEDRSLYNGEGDSSSNEVVYKTEATGFVIYPQALNPFLRIMETLKLNNQITILPAYNQEEGVNIHDYLIVLLPDGYPTEIVTKNI